MDTVFTHGGEVECPNCPPAMYPGYWRKSRPILNCIVSNYSGCSVDIGNCPECGKSFFISFKVDEITKADACWDQPSRKEREQAKEEKRAKDEAIQEAKDRDEFERLKQKFGDTGQKG